MEVDIKALMKLMCYKKPPDVPIQALNLNAIYIIGDALGAGFGSCCGIQGDEIIFAEFGRWSRAVTKEKSSNFWEGSNLVMRLRRLLHEGKIEKGSKVFIVTDNSVSKSISQGVVKVLHTS